MRCISGVYRRHLVGPHFDGVQNQISFNDIIELAYVTGPLTFSKSFHHVLWESECGDSPYETWSVSSDKSAFSDSIVITVDTALL